MLLHVGPRAASSQEANAAAKNQAGLELLMAAHEPNQAGLELAWLGQVGKKCVRLWSGRTSCL